MSDEQTLKHQLAHGLRLGDYCVTDENPCKRPFFRKDIAKIVISSEISERKNGKNLISHMFSTRENSRRNIPEVVDYPKSFPFFRKKFPKGFTLF
jgi:hypothetical protein